MGRRGQRRGRHRALATAAVLLGAVPFAVAQVSDGGRNLSLTFGQTLEYSDNIEIEAEPLQNTLRSSTSLGIAFSNVTQRQRLEFSLGADFEADNNDQSDVEDPNARFTYEWSLGKTRLSLGANYRRSDVSDFSIPLRLLFPDLDLNEDLVNNIARIETGIRTDSGARFAVETDEDAIVGLRLELVAEDRRYEELQLFDLADSTVRRGELETTYRISPQATARVSAFGRRFEADDEAQSERDERTVGVGLAYALSPGRELDLFLGHRDIEILRDGGERQTDGLTFQASLNRDLPNGGLVTSFSTRPTLNGRDTQIRVARNKELKRGRGLTYGLALSDLEGDGVVPLVTLSYIHPLRRGRFEFNLDQQARTTETVDGAVIFTSIESSYALALTPRMNFSVRAVVSDLDARLNGGENRRAVQLRSDLVGQIDPVSSWSVGLTLEDIEVSNLSEEVNDRSFGVQMSYRREMTRDWDMVARYQHLLIEESGTPDRTSNLISLGFERTFDYRF